MSVILRETSVGNMRSMSESGSPEPTYKVSSRENGHRPSMQSAPKAVKRPATPDSNCGPPPQQYRPMTGVPTPAVPTKLTAPVHIDIGGTIYTSTLQHLTKYPESKLAKVFNGTIPIILDTMKQHYFMDRDGPTFRHVLNFLRMGELRLPENYTDIDILLEEAKYYEIEPLVEAILEQKGESMHRNVQCIAVSICPDLGERISLSGTKKYIEECFPELGEALSDSRNNGWVMGEEHVIRFPVNGFCKLNSIQVIERLLSKKFTIACSNGGGVEGQQFSEFILTRVSSNR